SAAAALAPSILFLDAARAVQGFGGAMVMPLTLTILSAAVPAEKRGVALGAWGGISGLAVALGPLVGGAVVSGISWHWIFWLNVPIGLVLIPLALTRLDGTFGSIFLLSQFFQTVQGYSPFGSGLRILPWTLMPMFIAPIAGALSDRIGGHKLIGAGLAMQAAGLAWIAAVSTPTVPYIELVGPFIVSGFGMALFFAPVANVVFSSVRSE